MKKIIIFDAEPFCFGPISITLNLIEYLRKETDIHEHCELVLLGIGTSKQLAEESQLLDRIIECNTTSFDSLNKHTDLIKKADLFVSVTNPHSINFLNGFQIKRIFIDTLFWLWGELRADFSQVKTYYIQRFFNVDEQLQKFSPYIPCYKIVQPLIAYNLLKEPEDDFTLINLGGIDTIYHQTSGFYEALISKIYTSIELKNYPIVVAGGGKTIELLKMRYERENLRIKCFGKQDFKNIFTRCKKFITASGLTSIHESHFLGKDVFFLPAQNYSQYLHMAYLRNHVKEVRGFHYDDYFSGSSIAEFLPEDDGIHLVKQLSEQLVNNRIAIDQLIIAIIEFLQAPKKVFRLSAELCFFDSGVKEIAKDIVTLFKEPCMNSTCIPNPCLGQSLIGIEEKQNLINVVEQQALFRFHNRRNNFCVQSEKMISEMLDVKYSLVVTNCTSALKTALIVLEPMPGDYVLIPAISFIATANACLSAGLIPIMIDVDSSGHMDPQALLDFLHEHPKPFAVIAVHLDGGGCQIETIASICSLYTVFLIEDTARSFSVTRGGKSLGSFGEIGCFSFQENKILSTGEGGAIITQKNALFEKIVAYSDHGANRDINGYPCWTQNLGFGENFKATELTGAILLAQLSRVGDIRTSLRKHHRELVQDLPSGALYPRLSEDIPTVAWIDSPELIECLKKIKIPLISWNRWYLPEHPIIKQRRSFYRNGYPWDLLKIKQRAIFERAKAICSLRHSLPIPIKEEDFALLKRSINELVANI
ncbi:MAG: DegT/DnrJ/EryC1/StrS family aminotransferase [Candidatus Rhabdochlamydia sp.]